LHIVKLDKVGLALEHIAEEVEEAADKVGDDDRQKDQLEDAVHILKDERVHDLLIIWLPIEQELSYLVHAF